MSISRLVRPRSLDTHVLDLSTDDLSTDVTGALPDLSERLTDDHSDGELITPGEAAAMLNVKPKVLERWRGAGVGPTYVQLTSKTIRYRREDIISFIVAHVRNNTAGSSAASKP